jgi:hypothetical protein
MFVQVTSTDDVFGTHTHRSLDLDQPLPRPPISTTGNGKVICRDVLGGIVHEYERAA